MTKKKNWLVGYSSYIRRLYIRGEYLISKPFASWFVLSNPACVVNTHEFCVVQNDSISGISINTTLAVVFLIYHIYICSLCRERCFMSLWDMLRVVIHLQKSVLQQNKIFSSEK